MAYTNQLTKEQQTQLAQEKVTKALAKVNSDVFSLFDKDALPSFLAFAAKFHYFDIYNLILLYKQRPTATFVASFDTWGRISVNHWHDPSRPVFLVSQKGKGLGILVPYILKKQISDVPNHRSAVASSRVIDYFDYHVCFVFDKEQTNGIPAPVMEWALAKSPEDAEAAFHAINQVAPFSVVFSTDSAFRGNYVFEEATPGSGRKSTLVLNPKYRNDHYTLCNFMVRVFVVQYLEKMEAKFESDEFEKIAECIAFVVASHFGLDTSDYAFFFARTWASSSQRMLEILNAICQVAHLIIDEIELEMIEYKELVGNRQDIYAMDDSIFSYENMTIFDVFPNE